MKTTAYPEIPGLSVDLAATFQYYYLVDRDDLRDFMVEYATRIYPAIGDGLLSLGYAV
jgi:hypothetical protein